MWFINGCWLCGLLMVSPLIAGGASANQDNLAPNPGFELKTPAGDLSGWKFWPDGRTGTICQSDQETARTGKTSARLTARDMRDRAVLYTRIKMQEGKTYAMSFWFRAQDILPSLAKVKLSLAFNRQDGENNSAGEKTYHLPAAAADGAWHEFKVEVTPPVGTAGCQFKLDASGIIGTVWFDDVLVMETGDVGINVAKTTTPPQIGELDADPAWADATRISGFFRAEHGGKPAERQTEARLLYDDQNLYLLMKMDEPETRFLTAAGAGRDSRVWNDDCVEIFISPVEGRTYHFIVNSSGAWYDAVLDVDDQTMEGFVRDAAFNSAAEIQAAVRDDCWVVAMSIPFKDFEAVPSAGQVWRINFVRGNKISGENSSFSHLVDAHYQPKRFARLEFAANSARLIRETDLNHAIPLKIERHNTLFDELLDNIPGGYTTYWWQYMPVQDDLPAKVKAALTEEKWRQEVYNVHAEMGQAGMLGFNLPWAVNGREPWATEAMVMECFEKYGMRRKCIVESSAIPSLALKNGAEIMNEKALWPFQKVSLLDPVYIKTALDFAVQYAEQYKDKPYLWALEGKDEPMVHYIQGRAADMGPRMREWDAEVREKYGFGKYGLPAPDDPDFWEHPESHPFQNIAYMRWASDKHLETRVKLRDAIKGVSPEIKFLPGAFWVMSGFAPFDYAAFGREFTELSGDPYASSAERRPGRGIYNHGFGTKLLRDLGGKPVTTVVQAFQYAGYTPTPDDLREWVSQALKNGAAHIEYYMRLRERWMLPEVYREGLRISRLITRMNRVKLPENADTAIVVALDSEVAGATRRAYLAEGDEIYAAYAILGELVGSWFTFVSDRQLARNEFPLERYQIVYLPLGKYMTRRAAERILEYVEKGGVLVVGDPEVFGFDIDGTTLADLREKLTGTRMAKETYRPMSATFSAQPLNGLAFPLSEYYNHPAHPLTLVSEHARVIGEFPDGSAAVVEHAYGKGRGLYFAANPFAPDVLLQKSEIANIFRRIQQDAGAATDHPIWRFMLPAEGNEVDVRYVVEP